MRVEKVDFNFTEDILPLFFLIMVAVPIIPIEIYCFDSSNIEFAIVSGLFMMLFASFSWELHGKIMMISALYICYFSHTWTVYVIVVVGLCILVMSAVVLEKISELKREKQKRMMKKMYPLHSSLLDEKEKDLLSSLYGEGGHYYQVIQTGYVTDKELSAINARLKREISK